MTRTANPPDAPGEEAGGHLIHALGKAEQVTSALNRFAEMFSASIRAAQAPDLWDERIAALEERLAARIAEALDRKPETPRREPGPAALFMAQKAGLERLLIGFRVTLSHYSQHMEQMSAQRLAPPDLSPILDRLAMLETRIETLANAPAPALPERREREIEAMPTFSAEQAIGHRQMVGMRLLLRQFGIYAEGMRLATERLTERVRLLEESGPIPASPPMPSPMPSPAPAAPAFDLAPLLDRLEAIEKRLEARDLEQRPAPAPDLPLISPEMLAEKVRQESQGRQIQQLGVGLQLLGRSVAEEFESLRTRLDALAERAPAAAIAPATGAATDLAGLRPSLEKSVVAFQLLLRRLGEGVDRFDEATRNLASAESVPATASETSPDLGAFRPILETLAGELQRLGEKIDRFPPEPSPDLQAIAEALRERHAEMREGLAAEVAPAETLARQFLEAVRRTEAICLDLADTARHLRTTRGTPGRPAGEEGQQVIQAAAQAIAAQTAEFLAIAAAVSKEVSALAPQPAKAMNG